MKPAGVAAILALLGSMPSVLLVTHVPAGADEMNLKTCAPFTSRAWVNPYPPHESGTQYSVTTAGKNTLSCAQATAYAKKFVLQKVGDPQKMRSASVTGGPPGWTCNSGIDHNGYAYQGGCINAKVRVIPAPQFDWHPKEQ